MKKWIAALMLVWLLFIGTACAQTYELPCGTHGCFVCEDFEDMMPKMETVLMHIPGGEKAMQLAADTYVHVLGEKDGYLHVILPRGEITSQTDWDGTYDFVKEEDMAEGISEADARYKN